MPYIIDQDRMKRQSHANGLERRHIMNDPFLRKIV
jgi:hypothetical protein